MARKMPGKSLQQIVTSIATAVVIITIITWLSESLKALERPGIEFSVWKVIEFVQKFVFGRLLQNVFLVHIFWF